MLCFVNISYLVVLSKLPNKVVHDSSTSIVQQEVPVLSCAVESPDFFRFTAAA